MMERLRWPSTGRRGYQFSLRLLMLFVTLTCLLSAFWAAVVQPAREAARHQSRCTNTFLVHSGWHPPVAGLDRDLHVVRIRACWARVRLVPPVYYLVETGQYLQREDVPDSVVAQVESQLIELRKRLEISRQPHIVWEAPTNQTGQQGSSE